MSVAITNQGEPYVHGAKRRQSMRITATGTTGSIVVGFARVDEVFGLEGGTISTTPTGTSGGGTTINFAGLTNGRTYTIEIEGL